MAEAEDKKAAKGGAKKAAAAKGGDGAGKAPVAAKKAAKKAEAAPRAERPEAAPLNVDGYAPRLKKHYEEVVRPKLIVVSWWSSTSKIFTGRLRVACEPQLRLLPSTQRRIVRSQLIR